MVANRPRRRFSIADIMILVASTAGLFAVIHACTGSIRMGAVPTGIQSTITSAAVFLSLGGFGTCAARLRGRRRFEGFCWGVIRGPFGVLMIGLMPDPPED